MDEKKVREAIVLINNCIDVQEKSKRITHANISAINEDIKAYKIAIEALEKQLPKKPIEVVGAIYSNSYECKYCGNELEPQDMFGEYCKWCGQKL